MPYVARSEALSEWDADLDAVIARHDGPPWRQPLLGNDDLRVVLICWPPGFRTVPHHHPHASETFQVLQGRLGFRLDDRPEIDVPPGGMCIAHRGQVHGLRVLGDEALVLIACVGPNQDVPDEQVDVPDRWPDWAPSDPSAAPARPVGTRGGGGP